MTIIVEMINVLSGMLHREISILSSIYKAKLLLNLNLTQKQAVVTSSIGYFRKHHDNGILKNERKIPTLIYIQNPITWLINKIDFKMLKNSWDPEFDENEFKLGTIQAASVICTLISKNLWDNLRGLVTRQALSRLKRDVEINWNIEQRKHIFIHPCDIKIALPKKVHFLSIADQKFVDVDMMFVAMKFKHIEPSLRNELIIIELVARFHRNYTRGELPNWTVTLFKVTNFSVAEIGSSR